MKGISRRRAPLPERLWSKVERGNPEQCWPWFGHITRCGYGRIWGDKGKNISAHQAAWIVAGRELPTWPMVLDHVCRNRVCCNVEHMRVVSQHFNSTTNSVSPLAKNALKTHCAKGHPFSPENTAVTTRAPSRKPGRRVGRTKVRICLTCFPAYWRHAIIPRPRPPGSRVTKWDLQKHSQQGDSK